MNLSEFYTQVFFSRATAPAVFELALMVGGKEVKAAGYQRLPMPAAKWTVARNEATATAQWGPFPVGLTFDEAAILVNGTAIHVDRFGSVTVPRGGEFTWTPTLVVVS